MSVVVLALLIASLVVSAGLFAAMYTRDEPLLGGLGICVLVGPSAVLTFLHLVLSG